MVLEQAIEEQLKQRLTGKEVQEEINNKIRISINKVLQQYFYHDKYDSEMDADGYQMVEKATQKCISDQRVAIEEMIDKFVDEQIEDYVERTVKRVLRGDKVQKQLERMINPIVKEQMKKVLDARDLDADQKMIENKVEETINKKTKAFLRKIKVKVN